MTIIYRSRAVIYELGGTALYSMRVPPASFAIEQDCVCVCSLPIYSGHQLRWTYQPGSHRRKVTQDFSSTFLLRCVPQFFSREGFSHSFPSSTVKSNFVYSINWSMVTCQGSTRSELPCLRFTGPVPADSRQ